jgi:hypothetical protein
MKEDTFSWDLYKSWYNQMHSTFDGLGNSYWLYLSGVTYTNGGSVDIRLYKNCREYPPPNAWSKTNYWYTDCIYLGSKTVKVGEVWDLGEVRVKLNSIFSSGGNFTVYVDIANFSEPVVEALEIGSDKARVRISSVNEGPASGNAVIKVFLNGELLKSFTTPVLAKGETWMQDYEIINLKPLTKYEVCAYVERY